MFILKKGHQPRVYVPLRALFLVHVCIIHVCINTVRLVHVFVKGVPSFSLGKA